MKSLTPLSRVLVTLRIGTGLLFVRSAVDKIAADWLSKPVLAETIRTSIAHGRPAEFYLPWLKQVVLMHAGFFAFMLVFSELLIGAALLLGLFGRAVAVVGIVLMVQISLATGDGFHVSATAAFTLIFLTFFLEPPGRIFGLDRLLRKKLPAWRDYIS